MIASVSATAPDPAPPSDATLSPLADAAACHAAFAAHDARFDGRLYIGVTSTGIYCRPVCRVRTPRPDRCRYFAHAAAAEAGGFRPCLRCRPELAPGQAGIDMGSRLAWAAAQRIEAGALDHGAGVADLAARLGITDRHLRRIFVAAYGVTPIDYAQTQRLLAAKRLLTDTTLPVTEVALAAGFGSVRRFNALFQRRYRLTPGAVRRTRRTDGGPSANANPADPLADPLAERLTFRLAYRPPFDAARWLAFLAARCVAGVESVADGRYRRSVGLPDPAGGPQARAIGWLSLHVAEAAGVVEVEVSAGLGRVLPAVLAGVRRVCDLACEPQAVARALGPLAADAPGLRLPGAFDGFELAVRAVLGQQVTVKAAHTLAGRLVAACGEPLPLASPWPELTRLFPTPARLAATPVDALAALGLVRSRAAALVALAQAVADGRLDLGPSADVGASLAALRALPGIGPWTAQYIALRALGWPDAWPSGDVALIKALGAADAAEADARAEAWRPWRGYATVQLWRRLAEGLPAFDRPDPRPSDTDPTRTRRPRLPRAAGPT